LREALRQKTLNASTLHQHTYLPSSLHALSDRAIALAWIGHYYELIATTVYRRYNVQPK
jgi:hypothetical protein